VVFKTTAIDRSAIPPRRTESHETRAPRDVRRNGRFAPGGLIWLDCHQPWWQFRWQSKQVKPMTLGATRPIWLSKLPYAGPNVRHHCRMVSYDTTMPRCARRSSVSRKLRQKRWYSQTAWLMISEGNR